ncbi:MAG: FkbM family methyltransferase [Chthoniobacteraceae bacterium]|jgi:FkbM family methyltransferase
MSLILIARALRRKSRSRSETDCDHPPGVGYGGMTGVAQSGPAQSAAKDPPKHADLIYDVGMHKGEDTDFYLRKGFRVVAIEADPDLAAQCRLRFKPFIDRAQLTVVEGAIVAPDAAGSGTIRFYKNEHSVYGTVCGNWAERNSRMGYSSSAIDVQALDFAAIIREHGVPHYLKIDIEGCDLLCVDALTGFRERPDYISLELDKLRFADMKLQVDILAHLGYHSFQAIEQSALPKLQAPPNPAREGAYAPQSFEHGSSGLFGDELPGPWKSRRHILSQCRAIHLGYHLFGDDGAAKKWKFRGSYRLSEFILKHLPRFTESSVPGWHDLHARLS